MNRKRRFETVITFYLLHTFFVNSLKNQKLDFDNFGFCSQAPDCISCCLRDCENYIT